MIFDNADNHKLYSEIYAGIDKAMRFALNYTGKEAPGIYPIEGDDIFASINEYNTITDPDHPFEAHKKYIDLQMVLKGTERIDISHCEQPSVKKEYCKEKDILFIYPPEDYSSLIIKPGLFVLLFPWDYHRPSQAIGKSKEVKKLVVKIGFNS